MPVRRCRSRCRDWRTVTDRVLDSVDSWSSVLRYLMMARCSRISGLGTWTGARASIIAILASFSASSRSVFRLVFFQDQASSLVLQTMVLSFFSWQISLIQPEGPQASITTRSMFSKPNRCSTWLCRVWIVSKRCLPISGVEEAADGVELAEVDRKDHHERVPWFGVSTC